MFTKPVQGNGGPEPGSGTFGRSDTEGEHVTDELQVRVDQDLCTGDGLCVQYAPEVCECDIDVLAYVKDANGTLQMAAGSRVSVPAHLRLEVLDAAKDCPGECIHVTRASDGAPVAGPDAA